MYEGWVETGGRFQLALRGFSCIEVILITQLGTSGLGDKAWVGESRFECTLLGEGQCETCRTGDDDGAES